MREYVKIQVNEHNRTEVTRKKVDRKEVNWEESMDTQKQKEYKEEYPYKDFINYDNTLISVEIWEDSKSVEMHCHAFNEFALITKGSCIHNYRGVQVPLMPGDIFVIEPNQPHGYEIQAQTGIINCMFYPELLNYESNQVLRSATASSGHLGSEEGLKRQWDELLQFVTLEEVSVDNNVRQAHLDTQGIIHLDSVELEQVEMLLKYMADEQERQEINIQFAKSAYLQLVLVILSRVQNKRKERIEHHPHQKKDLIFDALIFIEKHLDEKINFLELAEKSFMSPNYFRTIFKDVTGLTPVEYLNRMRIVKSLEYLEREKCSIADAAAKVGIYDANYYSRLFKKIMGYSPRYFKSIS